MAHLCSRSQILPEKGLLDYQRRHFNTTATSQCGRQWRWESVRRAESIFLTLGMGSSRVHLLERGHSERRGEEIIQMIEAVPPPQCPLPSVCFLPSTFLLG